MRAVGITQRGAHRCFFLRAGERLLARAQRGEQARAIAGAEVLAQRVDAGLGAGRVGGFRAELASDGSPESDSASLITHPYPIGGLDARRREKCPAGAPD